MTQTKTGKGKPPELDLGELGGFVCGLRVSGQVKLKICQNHRAIIRLIEVPLPFCWFYIVWGTPFYADGQNNDFTEHS
jgi:hypothetical protein